MPRSHRVALQEPIHSFFNLSRQNAPQASQFSLQKVQQASKRVAEQEPKYM
jgi:hypothetical protein